MFIRRRRRRQWAAWRQRAGPAHLRERIAPSTIGWFKAQNVAAGRGGSGAASRQGANKAPAAGVAIAATCSGFNYLGRAPNGLARLFSGSGAGARCACCRLRRRCLQLRSVPMLTITLGHWRLPIAAGPLLQLRRSRRSGSLPQARHRRRCSCPAQTGRAGARHAMLEELRAAGCLQRALRGSAGSAAAGLQAHRQPSTLRGPGPGPQGRHTPASRAPRGRGLDGSRGKSRRPLGRGRRVRRGWKAKPSPCVPPGVASSCRCQSCTTRQGLPPWGCYT